VDLGSNGYVVSGDTSSS